MNFFLIAAFSMGLLGSLHCVGMCGPIALAIPVGGLSEAQAFVRRFVYQSGRTLAYGLLGLVPGVLGEAVSLAGFQQMLSVVAGLILLVAVFAPRLFSVVRQSSVSSIIQSKLKQVWVNKRPGTYLAAGFLNGLLPCGFIYMALAGSFATGVLWQSILFMLFFGLGTWPAMLGISWVWTRASAPFRRQVLKFAPVFTVILGLLFVLRGLNMQAGMLSPTIEEKQGKKEIVCCKKP